MHAQQCSVLGQCIVVAVRVKGRVHTTAWHMYDIKVKVLGESWLLLGSMLSVLWRKQMSVPHGLNPFASNALAKGEGIGGKLAFTLPVAIYTSNARTAWLKSLCIIPPSGIVFPFQRRLWSFPGLCLSC